MAKLDEKIDQLESEGDRVFMWRYECLLRAGVPDEHAGVIAASDYELRRAVDLAEAGCSPALLVRITA